MSICFPICAPNLSVPLAPPPCYICQVTFSVSCPTIPSGAVVATPDVLVQVFGNLFTATSQVFLDGAAQATTFVSDTELTFTAPVASVTTPKVSTITVKDSVTGEAAGGSCDFNYTSVTLTVVCPLAPATALVGSAAIPVTVNGSNFTNTCEVLMDGVAQTTTFVSATQLRFQVNPAAETARTATISVRETAPGGITATTTCPFVFTTSVLPVIATMFPDYIGDENPAQTLTVTGANFDATSVIQSDVWGDMPTTLVNATTLTTRTTGAPMATHSAHIHVRNGTLLSADYILFNCVSNPTVNVLSPASAKIGGASFTLRVVGDNVDNTVEVLMDGVPLPTTWISGGEANVTINPAAETVRTAQITMRLGHYHGTDHDNVTPVPFASLPFQFTA